MHETNWIPGIVVPRFSRHPLADEGEATAGPDHLNPATDPDAREEVERIKRKREMYREGRKFLEEANTGVGPLSDPPGFFGTDVEADLPGIEIEPTLEFGTDPFPGDGPQF